jgi:hypothetical protein
VDWLPVPAQSWRRLAGHHLTSANFEEPAEASVYCYLHHRFQTVILGSTTRPLRVAAGRERLTSLAAHAQDSVAVFLAQVADIEPVRTSFLQVGG